MGNSFRKRHAVIIFIIVVTVCTIILIFKSHEISDLDNIKFIELEEIGVLTEDGKIEYVKSFDPDEKVEIDIEKDITNRREETDPEPDDKKECWQCGKMIGFAETKCPKCRAMQPDTDTDIDGMPDYWEQYYKLDPENEDDAEEDLDKDGFTNLKEFRHGTNPMDPKSNRNTKETHFEVIKIYRLPVELLFRGYVEKEEGYTLTLNWEGKTGKTYFKEVGDSIHGYEIIELKKIIERSKRYGVPVEIDKSYIILRDNMTMQRLRLRLNKVYITRELYARIKENRSGKVFNVHAGSNFQVMIDDKEGIKETYTVSKVLIDQVFYKDSIGNEYNSSWR
ncbi:MAG: hypothetical protein KAI43_02775 [Candidatus Aureabacteria bacterium]|nr:hypothetical protein [Candidatus Auribacterota bacterium]